MKVKEKKLSYNIIFYTIKQLSAILFPMIVYPYVTRILGAENLGVVEYAKSLSQYFILIAGLGISDYAIREGARIRDNKDKFNQFSSQILVIHIVSSAMSFLGCIFLLRLKEFREIKGLLLLFALQIPANTIGMNWIYSIFEEYQYISVRTIFFQFVSAGLVFLFVRKNNDYYVYALILVISSVGANLLNILKTHEYFSLDLKCFKIKKHLKPIFMIFAMTLASSIYTTMDTSMLGFLDGTKSVGYYSAANKLIVVIGTFVAAIRTVLLPRLSYMAGKGNKDLFKQFNKESFYLMMFFAVPLSFGMYILSDEIILIFCGKNFMEGAMTLRLLSPEIILSVLSGFVIYQIFMPMKRENSAFVAVAFGAIVNLLLNYFLIPRFHQNGAAIATIISEMSVFLMAMMVGNKVLRDNFDLLKMIERIWRFFVASGFMAAVCVMVEGLDMQYVIKTAVTVVLGACVYFISLVLLKESTIMLFINQCRCHSKDDDGC